LEGQMILICVNGISLRGNVLGRVPARYIAWPMFAMLAKNDNVECFP